MLCVDVREEDTQLSYCSLWAPLYMDVTNLEDRKTKIK